MYPLATGRLHDEYIDAHGGTVTTAFALVVIVVARGDVCAHTMNPWYVTDPSLLHDRVDPADAYAPAGPVVPVKTREYPEDVVSVSESNPCSV
mmetsp:Transcript_68276/g.94924  ORF Transcript_68276/g.94924 Transcript_68276/m.94924 type:complete len:93 (-) Transcript_68276:303-581(-)